MKIYLAGPVFTAAERYFNTCLAIGLRAGGHEIWLPQEHDSPDPYVLFKSCIDGILWSDVVVACMDGPDPDSGTSSECGFAYQKRPIVAYRTDFRKGGDCGNSNYNLMLNHFASVNLDLSHVVELSDPVVAVATSICAVLEKRDWGKK